MADLEALLPIFGGRERTSGPPRRGERLWDQSRIRDGEHPNGYITVVDYSERTVVVKFYDSHPDRCRKTYAWHELDGNWTDKLGGQYLLYSF